MMKNNICPFSSTKISFLQTFKIILICSVLIHMYAYIRIPFFIYNAEAEEKDKEAKVSQQDILLEIKNNPFFPQKRTNKAKQMEKAKAENPSNTQKPKILGVAIHKNKKVAIIEIGGETFILTEGDEMQNIKVLKIDKNYVELKTAGESGLRYKLSY